MIILKSFAFVTVSFHLASALQLAYLGSLGAVLASASKLIKSPLLHRHQLLAYVLSEILAAIIKYFQAGCLFFQLYLLQLQ